MSPVAHVVAAVAVLALAAPAQAAKSEIVLVADGPSYAVVNLPGKAFLNFAKTTVTGTTPFAMIVVNQGKTVSTAAVRLPKRDVWHGANESFVPKGKSTLRLVAVGRVTIRIPVTGVNGSRTIRLTKRLTDTTAVVRDVPVQAETVTDDIEFTTRSDAVVVHGLTRRHDVPVAGVHRICVRPAGEECGPPTGTGMPGTSTYLPWTSRSSHAYVTHTGTGLGQLPVQHFLFAVPYL